MAIIGNTSLMPRAFSAGLNHWSRTTGLAGTPHWGAAGNASIVPADEDFGSCLEVNKQDSTTSLRYFQRTPLRPGTYLRIAARVKAVAGNMPRVRIAAWAGNAAGGSLGNVTQVGPQVSLLNYGEVVEVSAIVGSGVRDGVDMAWGRLASFGHFGLDLLGDNLGTVRIESIVIEDVTSAFIPQMLDWVDVRDFGAVGDGVADDRAAFLAADQAANGRQVLVPEGRYRIGSNLSLSAPVRFRGKLVMPRTARLALHASFDFPTYADAFGDETEGFKRAIQALLGYTDHSVLDLRGRRVDLTEPVLVHEIAPETPVFSNRRVIANGQINTIPGPAWNTTTTTSEARYDPDDELRLTDVVNVARIEVGSRVSGAGVGREVYVQSRNLAAKTIRLSQPLFGGAGTRKFTFERYRYALDFSGMERLDRFNINDVEFLLDGVGSGIMLAPTGATFCLRSCYMTRPKDRGITSIGSGCQDILVDSCQFLSNEMSEPAQNRTTIAINVNNNDAKIRHSRFVRFCHFMVANGGGHIIEANHWFQGDNTQGGVRFAGLVLTQPNVQTTLTANYIDNASVEWTNEHSAKPDFRADQYSFGGLTVTGNTFLVSNAMSGFSWLVMKPFGAGHFVHGLSVIGNVFKSMGHKTDRIDKVDSSYADLNYDRMRNISFQGNIFNGIETYVANPVDISHNQNTAINRWVVNTAQRLPFNGYAQKVETLIAESAITTAGNARVSDMPWVETRYGAGKSAVAVNWPSAVRGKVGLRIRMDTPD